MGPTMPLPGTPPRETETCPLLLDRKGSQHAPIHVIHSPHKCESRETVGNETDKEPCPRYLASQGGTQRMDCPGRACGKLGRGVGVGGGIAILSRMARGSLAGKVSYE